MSMSLKRAQRGVTLFELMLVLFVAAFIAAAVGTIYSRVNNSYKANATLDGVQQFVANIRGLYAQQGDYTGLTQATLMTSGLVPAKMCTGPASPTSCTTLIYPFGTATVAVNGTTVSQFTITLDAVPKTSCNDLGSRFLPGVRSMTIGGATADSTTTILTACAGAGPFAFVLNYD